MNINDIDEFLKVVPSDDGLLEFYSPMNKNLFYAYGSECLDEGEYSRLSKDERAYFATVNKGAAWLSGNCAGIGLKFETDSTHIDLKVSMWSRNNLSHMAATGQCGFDLYVYDERLNDYVLHSTSTYDITKSEYSSVMLHFKDHKMRKYILNFPLYMGLNDLKIGLDKGAKCHPVYFTKKGKLVFYGTSITQGGCVSRPGMLYTNIISRKLDIECLNFGFSGSCFAEKEIAEIISSRKEQLLLVIDPEANGGANDTLKDRLIPFIETYKIKQPNVPLILCSRCLFAMDLYDDYRVNLNKKYIKLFQDTKDSYKKKGYQVEFLDGSTYFEGNFTEYTVDGIHPTDFGSYYIAMKHLDLIRKMLNM